MRPYGKAPRSPNIGNIGATSNAARRDAAHAECSRGFHHGLLGGAVEVVALFRRGRPVRRPVVVMSMGYRPSSPGTIVAATAQTFLPWARISAL